MSAVDLYDDLSSIPDSDLTQILLYALKNNALQVPGDKKDRKLSLSNLRQAIGDRTWASMGTSPYSAAAGDRIKIGISGATQEIILPGSGLSITTRNVEILIANATPYTYGLRITSGAKINGGTAGVFITVPYARVICSYQDSSHGWVITATLSVDRVTVAGTVAIATYTANSSVPLKDVTGLGLNPSWFFVKCRNYGNNWAHINYLCQIGYRFNQGNPALYAEANCFVNRFSDGYRLGAGNGDVNYHNSGSSPMQQYVAYGISESDKFKILLVTGNGSANRAIAHGLGAEPLFIIVKSVTVAGNWYVYHRSSFTTFLGQYFLLNTGVLQNNTAIFPTKPDSEFLYLGNHAEVNQTGQDYHVYAFADKPGFYNFGSYVGNGDITGNGGPSITCGFSPTLVLVKEVANGNYWFLWDNLRGGNNFDQAWFHFDDSSTENTNTSLGVGIDKTTDGFKIRTNNSSYVSYINRNGSTYIYIALR